MAIDRAAIAELLRIPLEPPAVEVAVRARRDEDGIALEDVAWPSLDGQRVPAWLARPAAGGRRHAVICLHGSVTDRDSEMAAIYRRAAWSANGFTSASALLGWARELARRGHIAVALTQRGRGDRGPSLDDQVKDLAVRGRRMLGAIVHEIRQAATWLLARDDVASVSVAGYSFGGITAFWSWLVDPRLRGCASICGGLGSVDVLLREGQPSYHGPYWWLPDLLLRGDHADLAASRAPAPLLVWAPTEDIGMPRAGVDRLAAALRPVYARAGAADALVVHQPPGPHDFGPGAFEALVGFLDARVART